MKKESKAKKFKIASLIALVTGGLFAGGVAYNNAKNADPEPVQETASVANNMTVKQMQDFITESDIALEHLKSILESDDANPEEQFEARRTYNYILQERDRMQGELDKIQKRTILFDKSRGGK